MLGGGKFEDVTDKMGVGSTRWTLAAASADFNGDGWPDIYLANDYGPEELYLNDHGRRFVLTTAGLESESKSGMSVDVGRCIQSRPARRIRHEHLRARISLSEQQPAPQRDVRVAAASATSPKARSPTRAGRGARSSVISTTTAPTSSSSPTDSSRPIGDKNYWYAMSKIAGANGRFFEDAATWPPFGNASLSGYEPSRVYINRGVAGWVDVAKNVGATDLYDGRAVALADLSNRGAVDVIVANQNQPAVLYRDYPDSSEPLDRLQARRHAQQSQRDRRRGGAGVGRSHAAAGRRWRIGIREPERPAAALRARDAGVGGPRRRSTGRRERGRYCRVLR